MLDRNKLRTVLQVILVIGNLSLVVIYFSGWTNARFQNNKKTIIRRLTLSKEPVEISFKLKGQHLKTSEAVPDDEGIRAEEFEGDVDWLKDLTLKLRNTSGKTITYIVLNLHFPEVTNNGRTALHQIFLGIDPDRKFQRAELQLAPNESIEIPLAARNADLKMLVQKVGNLPVENVSKVWVEFHAATFDDGTLFETGTLYQRNPNRNDPQKWIKIANQ
jgi:hypothetical protein